MLSRAREDGERVRGHSLMTSAERGREGGPPNTDAVREVAWI